MFFTITTLFTLFSAYYDAQEFKAGRYIKDHTPRAAFRLLVLMIISFLTNTHILISLSVFYLLFDLLLNLFWGKPWNYIGSTSVLDRLTNKIGGWIPQYIFKITILIITINLQWILKFLESGLFG